MRLIGFIIVAISLIANGLVPAFSTARTAATPVTDKVHVMAAVADQHGHHDQVHDAHQDGAAMPCDDEMRANHASETAGKSMNHPCSNDDQCPENCGCDNMCARCGTATTVLPVSIGTPKALSLSNAQQRPVTASLALLLLPDPPPPRLLA
ncbi:MAG: hypothetical protein AAFW83_12575 [Pseudomonadota bacterium]